MSCSMMDAIDAAWATLCAPGQSDQDVREACQTLLKHCQDGRRATAQALLDALPQENVDACA